jgi:hypothetical protein
MRTARCPSLPSKVRPSTTTFIAPPLRGRISAGIGSTSASPSSVASRFAAASATCTCGSKYALLRVYAIVGAFASRPFGGSSVT